MYTTAMFDLDGTLIQTSREYAVKSVNVALTELGLTASDDIAYDIWIGITIFLEDKVDIHEFYTVFDRTRDIDERIAASSPYPDVIRNLDKMKEAGMKIGIVTTAPRDVCYPEIDLIGLEYFDSVIIANHRSGVPFKPDPTGIELCLQQMGRGKEGAFYAGNATSDIMAAERAGVYGVHMYRGENEIDVVPKKKVTGMNELWDIIS
jgi:phosphoglycolate phosphatase